MDAGAQRRCTPTRTMNGDGEQREAELYDGGQSVFVSDMARQTGGVARGRGDFGGARFIATLTPTMGGGLPHSAEDE